MKFHKCTLFKNGLFQFFLLKSFFLFCSSGLASSQLNDSSFLSTFQNTKTLYFQENLGQIAGEKDAPPILYKADSPGLTIYLTEKGLTYYFIRPTKNKSQDLLFKPSDSLEWAYDRFDIDIKNATISKKNISSINPSSESYNFFYGHCKKGVYGVKNYAKLLVKNVYPGIDWVLYGSEKQSLKYDFIVHPGADPNKINLLYRSLSQLRLREGNLYLPVSSGEFSELAPVSFLHDSKIKIKSAFQMRSQQKKSSETEFYETEIGFEVEAYKTSETLVIDPLQLWWGTYFGGNEGSQGASITTDSIGNVFVLGNTDSKNLPIQTYGSSAYFQGTYGGITNGGGGDCFILKFSNSGVLVWATYFGGSLKEDGKAIKCDASGNIVITGATNSIDLPLKNPGGNTYYKDSTDSPYIEELFVSKFSNNGVYLWGTYFGGAKKDYPAALALDRSENIYITGTTNSSDFTLFNPGAGAYFDGTIGGAWQSPYDSFVLKFSNSGQLLLSSFLGGSGYDNGYGVSADKLGNVYFIGSTSSTDFYTNNPGGGAYFQNALLAPGGNFNGYILKLNSNDQAVWSTYLGGSSSDVLLSTVCDDYGNVFLCGSSTSYNFPTVNPANGAFYLPFNGLAKMVLLKFNLQSQLIWSTFFGTFGPTAFPSLAKGECNEIYFTFCCAPYCQTCPPMPVTNPGNAAYCDSTSGNGSSSSQYDIFIAAFANNGFLRWGTFFGGNREDYEMTIATDKKGNIFYTGQQGSMNYFTPADYQSYTANCIVNPGNGAYYQALPLSPTSTLSPPQAAYPYCVIGKFISPAVNSNYVTAGCGSTNSASIQTLSGWGPYSYTWSTGSHADSIANIPQGTYSYTITDHFFGCTDSKTFFLGLPSLSLNITSPNASICKGQSAQFIVSGANSFSWMPPQTLNASSGATVTASPLATTNYTVTGYNSPTCSSDSVINLIVHPLPLITVLGKDSVCKGSSVTYSAFGAVHYLWTPEQSFGSVSNSTAFAKPQQDVNCTIIGKDTNNCVDSTHFRIHVIPLPQMQVNGSRVICLGSASTLTASGAEQFIWTPFTNINYRDSAVVMVSPKMETSYTLTGINAKSCKDSLAITISILQLPEVTIMTPDSACSEVDFSLKAFGNGEFSWWSAASINCSQCQNATAQINTTTSFFVTLTDTNHCSNKDSLVVHLKPDCEVELIIPNIFTPNNDMVNDVFKLRGKNITNVICHILNRWGTHVYSFNRLEGFWNGDLPSGMGGADGVYFYVIYATDIRKEEHVYKGSVQLIR